MSRQARMTILNAYYLPGGRKNTYPSITPVNSFRVIFDHYFGQTGFVNDVSYYYDFQTATYELIPNGQVGCEKPD
jgi:hypothetical protein